MKLVKINILICLTLVLTLFPALKSQPYEKEVSKKVVVITVDGSINPSSAEFINSGIEKASEKNAECLVIKLNTPGGLLQSTRDIVSGILNSEVPVVVFVYPGGGQAASAGVFITLAGHIAAMAPGTNIGAAHPVSMQGPQDSIMSEKATNDAAAFIRTISEKRSRNTQWAEEAVRRSISITETEALKAGVIDTIAVSLKDLLEKIEGKKIILFEGEKVLNTKNAEIINLEMNFKQKILGLISDPNIAYILLMIGLFGIMFELYNPGAILPGIAGVISMILAFYSMQTLPVNYAGLGLIIFSIILFLLEIKVVSHGLLTIGGVISLIMGSIMLIDTDVTFGVISISWQVILVTVILTVAFFVFAIGFGIKAQKRTTTTGSEGIIGEIGETINDLEPEGQIRIHGELWSAESLDGNIMKGTKVKVVQVSNLKLMVRKIT